VEGIIQAMDDANAVRCGCGWEGFGYESAEECTENLAISEMVAGCFAEAYLEHESDVSLHFDCRLVGERARLSCLTAADCVAEEMQACETERADLLDSCPSIEAAASVRYESTLETCITGPASGCPDFTHAASTATYAGRTEGGGNDLSGSCGGRLGADHAHLWVAPTTATFTIDTEGSGFDTVLYILSSCEDGVELACHDDIDTTAGNHASRIEIDLEEGQEVIVVVDGWGYADVGTYELRFTQSGP